MYHSEDLSRPSGAAFLVEETDSLFTAVFFACQSFKLAARERVKGMRDPELLGMCSMNRCSLTLLSTICDIRSSSLCAMIKTLARWSERRNGIYSIRFGVISFIWASQLFDSPLQCVSILAQQSYRLGITALIASRFKIVDVLSELRGCAGRFHRQLTKWCSSSINL